MSVYFCHPWYNGVCDGCGAMLPGDRAGEAAEERMRSLGWAKDPETARKVGSGPGDLCPRCKKKGKEL